ncbi:MAG TPA: hypothetical protein VFQ77_07270 [Pseudonocardiaceae bacterium]|jgi:hypothetical protein|nr:hypothetical protein [Pseudonocardiaceae bacterium]
MKLPRNLPMVFSLWSIVSTASAAISALRAGRRDGDRVALVHGLASALVTITTAAVFIQQRRKGNRT